MPIRFRLMGLTIMQASKNFKSNRLLRISEVQIVFWRLLWNTWINWGWANIRWVLESILNGIHVAKNSKAVSSKDSRSSKENFGVSCNNKINWETLYEWRVYVAIHKSLSLKGIAKAMNTSSRVISGEYLQGLHVQQTIISNNVILMLDLAKFT